MTRKPIYTAILPLLLVACSGPVGESSESATFAEVVAPLEEEGVGQHQQGTLWDFLDDIPIAAPPTLDARVDCGDHEDQNIESWWMYSRLKSAGPHGHEYYTLAHVLYVKDPVVVVKSARVIYDRTTDTWLSEETLNPDTEVSISTEKLSAVTPSVSITERPNDIQIVTQLSDGSATHLTTKPVGGPVIYNAGTGFWAFIDGSTGQYAFPRMVTTGTITIDGRSHAVSGETWFDRQYAKGNPGKIVSGDLKWTWFNMQFHGQDLAVSAWEYVDFAKGTTDSFATVAMPDGTHVVTPMKVTPYDIWESPVSGQRYPTKFIVEFPSLAARLKVNLLRDDQEVTSPGEPRTAAASEIVGRYLNRRVRGYGVVEMNGNFHR